ncbi:MULTISPECIES: WD40/YVTN/BNR-like repeat-containing protein [Flavobacterium]|uniref:Oxidoreductase n=2 Tax=Flavobacterium TaxID=237 RepID=A0A940XER3_9FLAO|nr:MULTISPECIES: oxidoreductase [Flavobacterium]MBP4138344.1 oxidoreductase [Flavobacterium geliluteum]MDX6184023.1 oxidoreductase [Flavobacterium sp. Fl-33]MDX6187576.1 oxidoreductase [Flavobacterium sp. Fl-77]UFH38468.1 oxidoreductase [Flavobacterium sp. F-70]
MRKLVLFLGAFVLLMSFRTANDGNKRALYYGFTSMQVDTLFQDKISIRAIAIDGDKVWYGADNSRFGYYDLSKKSRFEEHIYRDTLKLEFRSIAQTSQNIYLLSVANPGLLYQVSKKTQKVKLVYKEIHSKVFYDSMQFWNENEGIAIGDPTEDTFSVIVTRDGGETWAKLLSDKLPTNAVGEGAFAASNTNVVVKGDDTWIVSGGKKSRVFYSGDKGKTWKVIDTPIIQGKAMAGIFTADFYDSKHGIIAGGDFEDLDKKTDNKAITNDGGQTWQLVAQDKGFGYASCVQYVPGTNAKELVCVGQSGIMYSLDGGVNWIKYSNDNSLFTIRFINKTTAIAAGYNKVVRLRFKRQEP